MTYGTTGYRICLSRDQLEGLVNYLVDKYPQAFFKNQTLKRPLKKNIVLDLEKDRVLDDDRREAAIRFYTRDWNYENALVPGAKRIDLNGQEVGTVTEQEHLEAKARVVAQRRERRERANELARAMGPIAVTRKLHDEGRISTDMLGKIPASAPPDLHLGAQPPTQPTPKVSCGVDLKSLRALWTTIDSLLSQTGGANELAAAALRVFVVEAEKVIGALKKPLPSP